MEHVRPYRHEQCSGDECACWSRRGGSFHDTHHHTAKENAVITRTATTAPVMPDELRKSLTATPKADTATVQPIKASLGTSPAGITLCTRQMSQCTT
jgi:hypothetical protein